jgi:hypothetical protein
VAYHSNRMGRTRRGALLTLVASVVLSAQDREQDPEQEDPRHPHLPRVPNPDEDKKLPNGKSQKDEIAKQDHREALKEAESLLSIAQQLRDELQKAGNYVVPVASVKKTEEIEKLARRIRGRLKA